MQDILTCSLTVMARPGYPRERQNSLFLRSKTMFGNCHIAIGESLGKQASKSEWAALAVLAVRAVLAAFVAAVALCCWQIVVEQQRWVNWDPFAKSRTIDSCRALGMACVLS